MIVFIGSGLFLGGLLGTRFTVLALIPGAACALSIAALAWAWGAKAPDWSLLDLIALLVFLQIGYLCSAGLRLLVVQRWAVGQGKALRSPL